jgi:tetratricopeptide (TPR) repeat protein
LQPAEDDRSTRVAHLADLDDVEVAGVHYRPVRRRLGIRAFGANAFTAHEAGEQLIERHDETGSGAGGHEELYVVLTGHARFEIDGEPVDAPAGTLVFVPALGSTREARSTARDTTVLVIGAPRDRPLPTSPFEYWYEAEPAYRAGDYTRAIAIVSRGLEAWPGHGTIHYQLACYHALAGDREKALRHLEQAVRAEPRAAAWAAGDSDLDALRDDPAFPARADR